ncbi:MAG: FecR domain-containing protein [Candidatus Hinthialibacter sp.]
MSNNEYCYRGCCTEWEQEILLYMDHELSPDSCERVQRHLVRCDECARFYRIMDREEQLLSGRLRHQVELTTEPDVIADLVMRDIPAFQPITFSQRVKEQVSAAAFYLFDRDRRHYSLAASILICVFGLLLTMRVGNVAEVKDINIVRTGQVIPIAPKEPIFVFLDEGEFIQLPDDSVIYAMKDTYFSVNSCNMNPLESSSINEERSLQLFSGKLCIHVSPHPAKIGFSVVCPNAKATVFGTQFYISTTTGANKVTEVGVREGSVMVEKRGKNQVGLTILEDKEMTTVSSFNGRVNLRSPYPLRPDLRRLLDCFNEARRDRSARRMLPVLHLTENQKNVVQDDSMPSLPE